ncbi:MAG TPA: acyl-CoA dehydrogenase family protein, partial [Solirubrobacterales bacterium]|nr:acyl-CoA dehydrogenase family protein [Solirubrobacterales bacterium]
MSTVENPAAAGPGAAATHAVTNQSEPLAGYNVFTADRPLVEAVSREGGDYEIETIRAVGDLAGRAETLELGRLANENPPKLRTHDRFGVRIDEVEFHPAWHELMSMHVSHGLHALPWRQPEPGAHVARAAGFMCLSQAEAGTGCPISMTYSVIPALRHQPEVADEWESRFTSLDYDPRMVPAPDKAGALAGMAMTEKQGGSDVRANTTTATPLNGGGPGAEYELVGHKWFCSAPMCDAFLVLAQTDSGISCFLMPRWTPDGERNAFHIERLKDKLGNRSNASSEVEFRGAWARMVGEEGRGVPTIIEMVNHTRLDCVIGAASGYRAGVVQALHHAAHRSAFGAELIDQPLMRNVLADLCVESEAATISALRLARSYDEVAAGDEQAFEFRRLSNAVLKYWMCKRAPAHAVECLECLGGNGYIEDSRMPRLYREAPLMSIWEGSGNVTALDTLRAAAK